MDVGQLIGRGALGDGSGLPVAGGTDCAGSGEPGSEFLTGLAPRVLTALVRGTVPSGPRKEPAWPGL